jgi:hypothetical protein
MQNIKKINTIELGIPSANLVNRLIKEIRKDNKNKSLLFKKTMLKER